MLQIRFVVMLIPNSTVLATPIALVSYCYSKFVLLEKYWHQKSILWLSTKVSMKSLVIF
nr:MAG TPA: RmuC family protein [Caudoviricetes sp.]